MARVATSRRTLISTRSRPQAISPIATFMRLA